MPQRRYVWVFFFACLKVITQRTKQNEQIRAYNVFAKRKKYQIVSA